MILSLSFASGLSSVGKSSSNGLFKKKNLPFCFKAFTFSLLKTAPPPVAIITPLNLETSIITLVSNFLKYASPYFSKIFEMLPNFLTISSSVSYTESPNVFPNSLATVDLPLAGIPTKTIFDFCFKSLE